MQLCSAARDALHQLMPKLRTGLHNAPTRLPRIFKMVVLLFALTGNVICRCPRMT